MGLIEAIREADGIIQSAHIWRNEKGFEWIESYYIWYRLFVPGVFDFEEVDRERLKGEYLIVGADQDRIYVWDPYEDRVYAFREKNAFPDDTVYIYTNGRIEGVEVEQKSYRRYGNAQFLPFVWVHVLRALFSGRESGISLSRKLRKMRVDINRMMSLASRYRKGRERKATEYIFEGHFSRVEQDIVYGRIFEAVPVSFDALYMLLGVDLNENNVRMLFGQIVPSDPNLRNTIRMTFVFETEKTFIVRTGMIWFEEEDFWHFLSYQYRPIILVYDRVWGAIFVEVSFPPARFWRTVIKSYDEDGDPKHVVWYVPRRYWDEVLQAVHVEK
jgi:hypothetical protein